MSKPTTQASAMVATLLPGSYTRMVQKFFSGGIEKFGFCTFTKKGYFPTISASFSVMRILFPSPVVAAMEVHSVASGNTNESADENFCAQPTSPMQRGEKRKPFGPPTSSTEEGGIGCVMPITNAIWLLYASTVRSSPVSKNPGASYRVLDIGLARSYPPISTPSTFTPSTRVSSTNLFVVGFTVPAFTISTSKMYFVFLLRPCCRKSRCTTRRSSATWWLM
mmetsp:Transcript_17602/g.43950  ORF Transcript_17602/g.43950 Transcript_17602/m.43950 type:complete len:222 (-) Transcript_17602:1570-2235(-)